MKKLYYVFIMLGIVCCKLNAQNTFQVGYSFGSFSIPILTNIIQNPSGQYIMTGTDGALPVLGTVTEIDSAANVVWSHEYVSSIENEIVDVKNVPSGGYVVAGSSNPGLVLMRLTSGGNVTWAKTYHITSGTEENASRVLPTSDGGFVVAGYVYSATPPGYARQDSANCFIVKVDSNGSLLWSRVVFCSVTYINDHVLNDVAETSDGYIFTGTMSQGASDNAGTYGLVLKTDFNGNTQYIRHFGSSGNDYEATSIVKLTNSTQLIGGDNGSQAFFITFNSSSGSGTGYQYGNGFLPIYINYNAVSTNDGNYALIGMAPLGFESYILKANPSNGAVIWGEQYNGGFASILPEGRQVADSGYIMVTTALGSNGYEYLVVKTNSSGSTSAAGCPPTSFSPTKSSFSPSYTTFVPDSLLGSTASSFGPTVLSIIPRDTIHCINIVCTPPPAPTATATPNTICAPQSSVITGSGSGTGVTYTVYDASTGGNLLGTCPLTVSPTGTTTYYVQASQGACTGTTRTPVTVTVSPAIGTVGAISGSASTCAGPQTYSISAVTNATSYTWSVSGGGSIVSGQGTTSISVNWTTAGGPYTVSVTATNSCGSNSNTLNVTVNAAPGAASAFALPFPACAGQNVVLSATSSGATTWAWSGPGGYSANVQNPTINNIQTNQAGVYTVTASNSCGSATASVNVAVNAAPTGASATANPNPVCAGIDVVLIGTATGASSYSWTGPNGFTSSLQSFTITAIQPNQAGTYLLTATNGCGSDTSNVLIVVNNRPTVVVASASPNPVCVGTTVNLTGTGTGAVSWSWTGPNSFAASTQNTSVNSFQGINAGTYTLSATNGCGSSTSNVVVTADSVPTGVNATANTTSTCFGTAINFTGTANGGTSYSWTGPNGFSSTQQNPGIAFATVADSGAYVFTATNICGNTSSTIVVNVDTFIQNLSATASPGDTLCTGSTISLVGNGNNVNTWHWTGPNGYTSSLQNPAIPNALQVNTGEYVLTASNACGSAKDSIYIFIENSTLTLTASSSVPSDSVCSGQSIHLFATGSIYNSYSWTGPSGFTSSSQNPTLSNATTAQSGTYTVTGNNSCGSKTASVVIQIDTLIQGLSISASPGDTVCSHVNVTLTGTGTGAFNWNWTGPNSFTSTQSNPTITNIQPVDSGLYILTASNSCGAKSDTVLVDVQNNNLGITAVASVDSACSGAQISLSGTGNVYSSYRWTGPGGFVSNQLDTTLSNVSTSQSGIYTLTGTGACGVNANTVNVTIDSLPSGLSLNTSANNNTTCQGQSITVTATSSTTTTWSWTGPNGFTANTPSFTLQNPTPSQQGLYYITATNYCGTSNDTISVSVLATPDTIKVSASSDSICAGSTVTLNASSGLTNIVWGGGQTGQSITVNQAGTYFYTANNVNGCTVHSDTINVQTVTPPVLDLFGSNPTSVCQYQQTIILHASSDPGVVVTWFPGGRVTDTLQITTPGEYFATGQKNGCTVMDSIQVTLGALPTVSFTDTSVSSCCTDVTVTPVTSASVNSYSWSDNSTGASDLLTQTGTYTVTVTTNKGCTATSHVNFNKVCISALATATPDSIYVEHTSQLNVTTGFTGNFSYQWQPADSIQNSQLSNPVVSPTQTTTYTVFVRDTLSGCSDSASVQVIVQYLANFAIPNVFAPNGGGINSHWFVINQGNLVTVEDIKIFDRWGELVFSSARDNTIEWDGTYRGKLQAMGNYVFYVKLKINATGDEKSLNGNLSLLW